MLHRGVGYWWVGPCQSIKFGGSSPGRFLMRALSSDTIGLVIYVLSVLESKRHLLPARGSEK
jgi:hypothetical protein